MERESPADPVKREGAREERALMAEAHNPDGAIVRDMRPAFNSAHPGAGASSARATGARPFYRKLAFWNTLIASFAVLLSQLPPVRNLLKAQKLEINVPAQLKIYTYLGDVHLQMPLTLYNDGGGSITIARIDAAIMDRNRHVWRLPDSNYYFDTPTGSTTTQYDLQWIVLKQGERWSRIVHFYKQLSEDKQGNEEELAYEFYQDQNKQPQQKANSRPNGPNEINPELVQRAKDIFQKSFSLHPGNYQFVVVAISESRKPIAMRGFDFTLFEGSFSKLKAQVDDYKYGFGGILNFGAQDDFYNAYVQLRPISSDSEVADLYRKMGLGS